MLIRKLAPPLGLFEVTTTFAGQCLIGTGSSLAAALTGRDLQVPSSVEASEDSRPTSTAAQVSTSGRVSGDHLLSGHGGLYSTHQQLSGVQKGAVALLSAFGAALSPKRADLVAALGETTGMIALKAMQTRMLRSPTGQRILIERPRITDETLARAASLPAGTFGHAYGQFMGRRQFRADERPPVRFIDDKDLAYVAQRSREVHDLWHVLFGCHTTVLGELALKALEFVQTGLPMAALSVAGAQWRLKAEERTKLNVELLPWALRAGSRSADLMCLFYEEHFQDDLDFLRKKWRIMPAPLGVRKR